MPDLVRAILESILAVGAGLLAGRVVWALAFDRDDGESNTKP